eukprot:SAG22_NODE_1676_length_3830_cov_3.388100_4_plen_91_part_00
MAAEGLARGAYHFGHPGMDAAAQAHLFAKAVGPLHAGEFVALDIEVTDKAKPAAVRPASRLPGGPASCLLPPAACASLPAGFSGLLRPAQ